MSITLTSKQLNVIHGIFILLCFIPFVSPIIALVVGISLSAFGLRNEQITKYIAFALKISIVLLGFGMNLTQVISASKTGFVNTAISVVFVMFFGILLTKLLKIDTKTGMLISVGTAICGGSAIAAIAPIINAKSHQISFSLVVVFVLNAVALVLFPIIGHHFHLSQTTFGNWAAIAIHDTSSVVGAGAIYGKKALEVATTVKLIRALWIIPLSLVITFSQKDGDNGKIKIPWFIGLFIVSILIAYFFPIGATAFTYLSWLGKRGMVIALFLIGLSISFAEIQKAGVKSFIMGVTLWLIIGISSFLVLTHRV